MVCLDEDDVNPQKAGRGVASTASAAPPNRNKETVDFVRSIRRLTPAATGVVVFFRSPSSTNKKNRGQCNTLLMQLCQGKTTRLHVQTWTDCTLSSLKLRSVSGLTSITQGLITACAPFAQLVHLNTGTLKEINLKNVDESDWRTIIYGDTETLAIYSSLTKLGLLPAEAPYDRTWAAIEDAVSFPALVELDLMDDYPFNDDLLFRGNGRTLRKLCIPFRVLTKNVLGRFNVFSRSGVTRMNLVDIDIAAGQDSAILLGQASTHIVQQIPSILEATTMLYLQGDTANKHMLNAVKSAPATTVLQSLELYNPPLDACDILSIILAIPSLVTLTCEIDGSVASIEALSASEHPTSLHEKYSSLNSNFRQLYVLDDDDDDNDDAEDDWSDENDSDDLHGVHECPCCGGFHYDSKDDILNDIYGDHYYGDGYSDIDYEDEDMDNDNKDDDEDDDEYEDMDDENEEDEGEDDDEDEGEDDEADKDLLAREIAVVAVQIAVLCPNFKHVDLPEEMRNEFSREVALAMANGPFLPYANSLERLIFSE